LTKNPVPEEVIGNEEIAPKGEGEGGWLGHLPLAIRFIQPLSGLFRLKMLSRAFFIARMQEWLSAASLLPGAENFPVAVLEALATNRPSWCISLTTTVVLKTRESLLPEASFSPATLLLQSPRIAITAFCSLSAMSGLATKK
jgi:hypothetical protein